MPKKEPKSPQKTEDGWAEYETRVREALSHIGCETCRPHPMDPPPDPTQLAGKVVEVPVICSLRYAMKEYIDRIRFKVIGAVDGHDDLIYGVAITSALPNSLGPVQDELITYPLSLVELVLDAPAPKTVEATAP